MSEEKPQRVPPTHGVFVSKGMRFGMPAGGLVISIGEDGKPSGSMDLHVALDVTPHWLEIALSHLRVAEQKHRELAQVWQKQDNEEISRALEAEFMASVQAIMAAAIGIDAFYAAVKRHVEIPPDMVKAWRDNGTARYKQVYETLRRGFKIGKGALPLVRTVLEETYRFRDLAVHPHSDLEQPLLHPDLGVGAEWRFVYFRFENAKNLVGTSLSLIVQLLDVPKDKYKDLSRYTEEALSRILPIVSRWEDMYGTLYPKSNSGPENTQE